MRMTVDRSTDGGRMTRPLLFSWLDRPSEWQWLDPVAARIKPVVDTVLHVGPLPGVFSGRAIGHPVHPPLAQAALSGWTGAAILGAAELVTGSTGPDGVSARPLLGLVGLGAAGPAVLAGLGDWSELHEDQQRTGLVHAAAMSVTAAVSLAARLSRNRRRSAWLDLAAGLVAVAGASLGGHLAYRWSAGPNHAEAFPHLAKEGWTRICLADELTDGELRMATVGDEPIVVGRDGDQIFAMADRCSHLGGPLHEGELATVGGVRCLVCPWHDSAFSLDDGQVRAGPAYVPQPTLEVRTVFGWVDVRSVRLPGVAGR
jgi:nitrite reductase/ring-hydroxylating ferredoxin subunit